MNGNAEDSDPIASFQSLSEDERRQAINNMTDAERLELAGLKQGQDLYDAAFIVKGILGGILNRYQHHERQRNSQSNTAKEVMAKPVPPLLKHEKPAAEQANLNLLTDEDVWDILDPNGVFQELGVKVSDKWFDHAAKEFSSIEGLDATATDNSSATTYLLSILRIAIDLYEYVREAYLNEPAQSGIAESDFQLVAQEAFKTADKEHLFFAAFEHAGQNGFIKYIQRPGYLVYGTHGAMVPINILSLSIQGRRFLRRQLGNIPNLPEIAPIENDNTANSNVQAAASGDGGGEENTASEKSEPETAPGKAEAASVTTQDQRAAWFGVDIRTIRNWDTGKTRVPPGYSANADRATLEGMGKLYQTCKINRKQARLLNRFDAHDSTHRDESPMLP